MEIICSLNIFIPLVCEEEQQKIAAKKAFYKQNTLFLERALIYAKYTLRANRIQGEEAIEGKERKARKRQ